MVMRLLVLACVVSGCSFEPPTGMSTPGTEPGDAASGDAEPTATPADFHLRVAVLVDGWSYLKIKGTSLHWEHHVYAAPGRWAGANAPTRLGEVDWMPSWPDVPTAENRDCAGCVSSTTTLPVGVPRAVSTTTLTEVQVRRAQRVVQAPAVENDYELIVEITDFGQGGGADYIVEIDVTVAN